MQNLNKLFLSLVFFSGLGAVRQEDPHTVLGVDKDATQLVLFSGLSAAGQEDPYTVLGVGKNATQDEIQKAYRKLSIIHHPDKGGNQEHFKLINQAREILLESRTLKDCLKKLKTTHKSEIKKNLIILTLAGVLCISSNIAQTIGSINIIRGVLKRKFYKTIKVDGKKTKIEITDPQEKKLSRKKMLRKAFIVLALSTAIFYGTKKGVSKILILSTHFSEDVINFIEKFAAAKQKHTSYGFSYEKDLFEWFLENLFS